MMDREIITPTDAWDRIVVQGRTDGMAYYRSGILYASTIGAAPCMAYVCSEGCCQLDWTHDQWLCDREPGEIEWRPNK